MLGVSLIYHHKQSIKLLFATRLANQSNFLPQGWLINQTVLPPYWLINQSFCHKADFIETFATRLADSSKLFVTRLTSLKVFATRLVKQTKHLYHSKRHKWHGPGLIMKRFSKNQTD